MKEVLIVIQTTIFGYRTLMLSPIEVKEFERGMAVRTRWGIEKILSKKAS